MRSGDKETVPFFEKSFQRIIIESVLSVFLHVCQNQAALQKNQDTYFISRGILMPRD